MLEESTYYLTVVGLGPGDPELVTMKGIRAIQAADLIFTPRTRPDEASRALRIAQPWIDSARQQVVPLTIPMERDPALATAAYQETASEILERLQAHPHTPVRAVYLLLGDPLLYGTFTNLRNALLHAEPGLAVTIIPGVTSFAATAAQVALPLSSGNDRVAILPAPEDAHELRALFTTFNTLILMKVGRHLPAIIATLSDLNLLDQAVYAERIGMPEERVVRDLASLRDYEAPYLSLLIVRRTRESVS
ncbi:precorrin-2 C20-methyltransferase [Oscillochloris trichoides DG-6]|uniref:Precorrin-2 C20-methyltransferase n=1 Tax=Oscillochloris trichoides DG-6 TaxID=765420 RepID=E1IGF3_9CHLR|nr:precorrin-2 C(20)-methyltransferase [Oscillochloris trichoides]EFO79719.1 precorrin-2 C20-methyltransferase [Oscillochloris trichoides DG-6]